MLPLFGVLGLLAARMTIIAGLAVIGIARNVLMSAVHVRLIMRVAVNAFKSPIITRNNVAIDAIVPLFPVSAGKYWEPLDVMIP